MDAWELVYYETSSGACPVREYLDSLPATEAERVTRKLDLLETFGTGLGPPHVDHIEGKLWELRVVGRVQHRALYVTVTGRNIVVLHIFTKKTRVTPRREIELAKNRLADYETRNEA